MIWARRRTKSEAPSICEGLFNEIDGSLSQPRPHGFSHVVRKASTTADRDGHGTLAIAKLIFDQGIGLSTTRIHLDCFARALNTTLGTRDEELDAKNVLALWHPQNLVHPWAHPLEAVRVGNSPDEYDLLRGGSAVCVPCNEVLEVHDLMGYANTTCEENDSAVGVEAVVTTVGTFDEPPGCEGLIGHLARALIHLTGESGTSSANETDLARLSWRTGDYERAFECGECHLFGVGGWCSCPRNGERVRGPERHTRHPHVNVAARAWGPVAHHVDGQTDSLTGHSLDFDRGALLKAEAIVED